MEPEVPGDEGKMYVPFHVRVIFKFQPLIFRVCVYVCV